EASYGDWRQRTYDVSDFPSRRLHQQALQPQLPVNPAHATIAQCEGQRRGVTKQSLKAFHGSHRGKIMQFALALIALNDRSMLQGNTAPARAQDFIRQGLRIIKPEIYPLPG